jgi:hypothetical protein
MVVQKMGHAVTEGKFKRKAQTMNRFPVILLEGIKQQSIKPEWKMHDYVWVTPLEGTASNKTQSILNAERIIPSSK